jgi:hypothetical protein
MPTSAFTSTLASTSIAAMAAPSALEFNQHLITPLSLCSIGSELTGVVGPTLAAGAAVTNQAFACPFQIAAPFLVRKVFWFNGTTATTDSADVGVYTEAGVRMVSGGGTAISGANALQEVDVTDTVLRPGRYWLAFAQNGTTATPMMTAMVSYNLRSCGCGQMASAYPLPSTFTPAQVLSNNFPIMGIASRTLAA